MVDMGRTIVSEDGRYEWDEEKNQKTSVSMKGLALKMLSMYSLIHRDLSALIGVMKIYPVKNDGKLWVWLEKFFL